MEFNIRHAEEHDIPAIHSIMGQPQVVAGTLQLPYPSLALWQSRQAKWSESFINLVADTDRGVVGHLGLQLYTNPRKRHAATFGMVVCGSIARRGIGSALLATAIDACDNWLNVMRLELQVFVDNEPAINLYLKHGFVIEGTHPDYAYREGAYRAVHSMARIHLPTEPINH